MIIPPAADRLFSSDKKQKEIANALYREVSGMPLICPHTHINPNLFVDPETTLGSPVDVFILPDHYIYRMLYSQGIPLETLGLHSNNSNEITVEQDHRKIWQCFADHFYLFRATPTGGWLTHELGEVFGVTCKLNSDNAQDIYDKVASQLALAEFQPRALYKHFNIEILCTTDAAEDSLEAHKTLRATEWDGKILPTFRPDGVTNLESEGWSKKISTLSQVSGVFIHDFKSFIRALENQREYFKQMGATATDHAVEQPTTVRLSPTEIEAIFKRALHNNLQSADAAVFTAHMLVEMARMSIEDGLVMQLHAGALRNYNPLIYQRFGSDCGADIPVRVDFTRNLQPLLSEYGNDPRLTLILFTVDDTTYSRELAPLAGHFPSVRLGPPWWFYDSPNGMKRFLDSVVETAGIYNTVGFNDDTRAFPSIPARHDTWRRVCCCWLADQVSRAVLEFEDAQDMAYDLSYRLPISAYKLKVNHG